MWTKSKAERGLRMKALPLIGAVWLIIVSGVRAWKAPSPTKAAPARSGTGSRQFNGEQPSSIQGPQMASYRRLIVTEL
jgi:hypothetical protein